MSQPEMALASFTQIFKTLCYLAVIIGIGACAFYAQMKISSPEWNVNFGEAEGINNQYLKYEKDKAAYNATMAQLKKVPRFDFITSALALTTKEDITVENIRVQTVADANKIETIRQAFTITGYSLNNDLDYVRSYLTLLEAALREKNPDAKQISINLKDASSSNRSILQKQTNVLVFNINGEIKL
jgi:hypothetical protein